MAIMFKDGQILFVGGQIAFDAACCCGGTCNGCEACYRVDFSGGDYDGLWLEFALNEGTCLYSVNASSGGFCSASATFDKTGGTWTVYVPPGSCACYTYYGTGDCPTTGAQSYSFPGGCSTDPEIACPGQSGTGGTATLSAC